MTGQIPRRSLLRLGTLALAGCGRHEPYFGNATPPPTQTLIYEIGAEPSGMDPAAGLGASESYIWPALFAPLVSADPTTLEPRAGLATHYIVEAELTEFTFFLRGHPNPRGAILPAASGRVKPALWSDGRHVTAGDFVFAWQRLVDPAFGGSNSWYLNAIANGTDIAQGKERPDTLGVRAIDDFTLRVILKAPAAQFLKVIAIQALAAVPRHSIQEHGVSWTAPGRMVSCGPFLLKEWKPYDRVVLRRNPRYYDAARVPLERIVFLPITDGATGVNLYKTGNAYAMHGRAVPPLWLPALRGRKDFHSAPAYRNMFYAFNTTRRPFDNALLRYAFVLATDRREVTSFLAGGQTPARTLVPPFPGYEAVQRLTVEAAGRRWDILAYDPEAARELLRLSGEDPPAIDLMFPNRTRSKEMAEILQKQWRVTLGVRVNLVMKDWNVWVRTLQACAYNGITEGGFGADYADPTSLLEAFNGREDGSGWKDPEFNRLIQQANAETDPTARMRKLSSSEAHLLRSMPLLPMFFDSYSYLRKPYIAGMTMNALDVPEFKGVWIDTNWRAA